MEDLKNTTTGFYGVSTLTSNLDRGTAPTLQEEILEEATPWTEKIRTMKDVIKNTSWLQQFGDQSFDVLGEGYEDEEGFELDVAGINDMLASRGLPDTFDNFNKVSKAKSATQLMDILDNLEITSFENEHADQVLTDTQKLSAVIGTEILSPENVTGIGLGVGLGVKTVKGALGVTGISEALAAKGRIETGEYKDWGEALPWVAASIVPELAIIHGINKFDAYKISKSIANTPTKTQFTNEQGQLLLAMPTEDRLKIIAKKAVEEKEKKRIFEASATSAKRKTMSKAERENLPFKQKVEEFKKEAEEVELDLFNEIEVENMLKKFDLEPKYESSAVKSVLRNMQKEAKKSKVISKKAFENSMKIDTIKTTIKTIETKIANIKNRAKTANRDISRGEKGGLTKLKKQLKTEKSKISSSLDAKKAKIEVRELNRLTRLIGETFDDTKDAIDSLTKHIKGLSVEEASEFKPSIDLLAKNNNDFKALQTDIANIIKTKKAPKKFALKNLTKKQRAMIIGSAIVLADNAQASEDGEPIGGIGISGLVLLIAGAVGIRSIINGLKGNEGIKQAMKTKTFNMRKAFEFSEANTTTNGSRVGQMKNELLDKVSASGLFDIYASLAKHGGDIKKYADDMLFSFEHNKYSAEVEASHLADASTRKVYDEVNNSFKQWLQENGISKARTIAEHDTLFKKFDEEVANAIETGKGSKAVKQVADIMKKETDIQFDLMVKSKVLGAKDMQKIEGYFSRMWKHDNIQTFLRMNPNNKELLSQAIKKALMKQGTTRPEAIDENVASLVNSFEKTYDNTRGRSSSEIFNKIEDLLQEGVDPKVVEARLAEYAERNNRLKGRLDFDVKELDGLKLLDGNGDEIVIDLNSLVDRSAVSVFTKNAHNNYSHVAMGKRGFPSRVAAMKHVDTITKNNPEAKRDLEDITNLIYGRRVNNESEQANRVANMLVDATIVANLGAVAFSTTVEAFMTFALRNPIKGITNAMKVGVGNKNDFLVTIQDKVPLGVSGIINKGNVRGFETNDATAMFNERNLVGATTHKMKMATVTYSGLSKISDFLQKVNLVSHTEILAEFLQTGKGLSKNRLNGYGIDDNSIALLKNKFEFKNGNVQTPNFDTWTDIEIETYANIMSRMNEEVTLTRTIGGSGMWQMRSNAGKLASSMLGYSTQLVSKQMIRGLKAMDMQTAKTSLLTFMGAYVGLSMRSQVEGKNYTDEQLATYAMLNMPIAQPYAILMGLSDPAVIQTTTDMGNAFKIQ